MLAKRSYRVLGLVLVLGGATIQIPGQSREIGHGNRKPAGSGIKAEQIELPLLKKTCEFPLATLPRTHFVVMDCRSAILPAGFFGKNSPSTRAVMIVYSHVGRNGGVLSLYELPRQKGMPASQMLLKVANGHIFKDVPHSPPWQMRPLMLGGTIAGPGCSVSYALDDAVADLTHSLSSN